MGRGTIITQSDGAPHAHGFARSGARVVPLWLFYPLVFISLALPNLIYSGSGWFDTLHIMKWAWTMVPLALVSLTGGASLALFATGRAGFHFDLFGALWFAMIVFISLQPLWAGITSWSTYSKEWFFAAALFAAYLFCFNLFDSEAALRRALWLANINAAVNVVFAELQIRGLNEMCDFVMNVPGNYVGNIGQQEIFGLWMAMAAFNGIFLHAIYSSPLCASPRKFLVSANLALLAINSWGLWNSTTRAGMLALFVGTAVLSLVFVLCRRERGITRRVGAAFAVVVFMLAANIFTGYFGLSRAYSLVNKTSDMILNTSNFGARREIWITSWNVLKLHPLAGVGLGHYKWRYLDGQREAMKSHPELKWQYTYWAHSEYLQLLAELGIFGALAVAAVGLWWLAGFLRALTMRRVLSPGCAWGCAMLFLIWFDALFSRPFHRIEVAIWMSLAFAWANREILSAPPRWEMRGGVLTRAFGLFVAAASVAGLLFFYSGCRADKNLFAAEMASDASLRAMFISSARKSLMNHDEALEQTAYCIIDLARASGSPEGLRAGAETLYLSFRTRPQAKQLVELMELARETGNLALMVELAGYFPPERDEGDAPIS